MVYMLYIYGYIFEANKLYFFSDNYLLSYTLFILVMLSEVVFISVTSIHDILRLSVYLTLTMVQKETRDSESLVKDLVIYVVSYLDYYGYLM